MDNTPQVRLTTWHNQVIFWNKCLLESDNGVNALSIMYYYSGGQETELLTCVGTKILVTKWRDDSWKHLESRLRNSRITSCNQTDKTVWKAFFQEDILHMRTTRQAANEIQKQNSKSEISIISGVMRNKDKGRRKSNVAIETATSGP